MSVRDRVQLLIAGPTPIRVMVVDNGFFSTLRTQFQVMAAGYSVVRTVAHSDKVLAAVADAKPDILVMGVDLPGESGIELARKLMRQSPLAIVLLTATDDAQRMKEAIRSGACSYLLRSIPLAQLKLALKFASIQAERCYCGQVS